MVFGFDDAVGRGAFAGDVAGREGGGVRWVLGTWGEEEGGAGGERDVQVDELAFVVFHCCCWFWGLEGKSFVIASALVEAYICRRKRFGGWSRLASWRLAQPYEHQTRFLSLAPLDHTLSRMASVFSDIISEIH